MSEMRPSRSRRAGNRGRHRHLDSPETRRWEEIANTSWLQVAKKTQTIAKPEPAPEPQSRNVPDTPEPTRPIWMDEETFDQLIAMRRAL